MGDDGVARLGVVIDERPVLTLQDVAGFAEGVGVVINNATYPVTQDFIAQAHEAGLKVHGWTFAKADPDAAAQEYQNYLAMGMDCMFSNYPDLAVKARDVFVLGK